MSGAIVGTSTSVVVIEVKRETPATREQIWELWSDVPNRTMWDRDLEYAKLDGPFRTGSAGEVNLVPVMFGGGARMLENLGSEHIQLETVG